GGGRVWDVESDGTVCVLVADCQWPQSRARLKPETMRVTFGFSPTHDSFDHKGLIFPGAARNQSPEATDMALAYSEANSSLSGYCSLNSRNNLCARAFCFSRRAARARIILANGRR